MLAVDPKASVSVPLSYAIAQVEKAHGQAPGAHRKWDAEDLLRSLAFQSLEASVKTSG